MDANMSVWMLTAPTFAGALKDFPLTQIKKHAQVSYKQQPPNFFLDAVAMGTVATELSQAERIMCRGHLISSISIPLCQAFLTWPKTVARSTSVSPFKAFEEGILYWRPHVGVFFQHLLSKLTVRPWYFMLAQPGCAHQYHQGLRNAFIEALWLVGCSFDSTQVQENRWAKRSRMRLLRGGGGRLVEKCSFFVLAT